MITLTSAPSDCLNGVNNCLELSFQSTNLVETVGTLVNGEISEADLTNTQVGSTISINDTNFTLIAGANNSDNNEIQFDANATTLLGNILVVIQDNYDIQKNYQSLSIASTTLSLTPKKAVLSTQIQFDNLSGGASTSKTLSFQASPVKVREGYSVMLCLKDNDTDEDLGELRIYAKPKANLDCTDIASHEIKKDVSKLLQSKLSCPFPPLTTSANPTILATTEMTRKIGFSFAEAYGSPLNKYKQENSVSPFIIFAGGYRREDENRLIDYCSDLLNLEETGVNVVCDQPSWLYKYVADPTGKTATYTIQLFDASGNTLANEQIGTEAVLNVNTVLAAQTGLIQIAADLAPFTDFQKVAYYDITLNINVAGIPITSQIIRYNVKNEVKNSVFAFKTSLGTYTSIATQDLDKRTLSLAQEFIELCPPCQPNVSTLATKTVKSDQFIDLEFFLFNTDFYQMRMLDEFYSSKEVYWYCDGKLYHVQAQNESALVFQRRNSLNPSYKCRLYV